MPPGGRRRGACWPRRALSPWTAPGGRRGGRCGRRLERALGAAALPGSCRVSGGRLCRGGRPGSPGGAVALAAVLALGRRRARPRPPGVADALRPLAGWPGARAVRALRTHHGCARATALRGSGAPSPGHAFRPAVRGLFRRCCGGTALCAAPQGGFAGWVRGAVRASAVVADVRFRELSAYRLDAAQRKARFFMIADERPQLEGVSGLSVALPCCI